MSEEGAVDTSAGMSPQGASAGAMLRQAREAAGLHIAALAVSLKVPVKKLEALESDRFDLLPDAVFVRALASSVCRSLKVDPAPILERLPQTAAPRLVHDSSGINAPFRAPSDGPGPSLWDQMSRPAVLAVLALLLGALVLIFLPDIQRAGSLASSPSAAPTVAVEAPPVATPPGTAMVPEVSASAVAGAPGATLAAPEALPVASAPAAATATLAPPVALSPSVALSTPTVASPTLVVTPAAPSVAQASAPAPAVASGLVTFKARQESWVEVTDARGTVALRKTLAPGEVVGASGAVPLSVVVGKADSTQVQVRGKPLDLAPLSRDNVARFEVK